MHVETEELIEAIKQLKPAIVALKQQHSIFETFIWPISLSFFSALMGFFSGLTAFRMQDRKKRRQDRIDATTRWAFKASECFENLCKIKIVCMKYQSEFDPLFKVMTIPVIDIPGPPIDVEGIENLTFLAPGKKQFDPNNIGFNNPTKIRAMFLAYNHTLCLWKRRNRMYIEAWEIMTKSNPTVGSQAFTNETQVIGALGPAKTALLVEESVHAVENTEQTLKALLAFLQEFPEIANSVIFKGLLSSLSYKFRKARGWRAGGVIEFIFAKTTTDLVSQNITINKEEYERLTSLHGSPPDSGQ